MSVCGKVRDSLPLTSTMSKLHAMALFKCTAAAIALLATAIAPIAAQAQITPDSTLGSESSTVTEGATIRGDLADLIEGGATRGGNLFHSFLEFNVDEAQRVYFASPDGIESILSRITGSDPSNIFGTLGVDGSADLFLLNPNGIVFGENAALDVGGSLSATTATSMLFGKVGSFSAINPEAPSSILTIAPSAFFFGQVEAATIINQSRSRSGLDPSGRFRPFGLRVPDGESLILAGGNINIAAGGLAAFGGHIDVGGLATIGSIGLERINNRLSLQFPESANLANVQLTEDAGLIVSKDGLGTVTITAGNLRLSNSSIQAGILRGLTSTGNNPGSIALFATENLTIEEGSEVSNEADSNTLGDVGDLALSAQNLDIGNGSVLSVSTNGRGNAGKIVIRVQDTMVLSDEDDDSFILNNVFRNGVGNTGGIEIYAGSLKVLNGAQIQAGVYSSGRGGPGDIIISAEGDVTVDGTEDIDDLNAFKSAIFTGISAGGTGNGGNLQITAQNVYVTNRAQLISETAGTGNAGNIVVRAQNNIHLLNSIIISEVVEQTGNGNGGDITLEGEDIELVNGSSILADTENIGDAGSIFIRASEKVTLGGEGPGANNPEEILPSQITATVDSQAARGEGGNIDIATGVLYLTDRAFIRTSTFGQGPAGDMNIRVNSLSALGGAEIATLTTSSDSAGDLFITATDKVLLSGQAESGPTEITSASQEQAEGEGGDTFITSPLILITDGARLSAVSGGSGAAGNVNLDVSRLEVSDSSIETNAAQSIGGDIRVNASDSEPSGIVILRGDGDITTDSSGNGGNIDLNSLVVALDDSDILARSEDARGGNITLGPFFSETLPIGAILPTENNDRVDVTADGSIASGTISALDVSFIENSLNELSGEIVDTDTLTAESCIARADNSTGSFIIMSRNGLSQQLGSDTVSTYPTGAIQTVSKLTSTSTIQEPQDVYQLADGRLVLSYECE